MRLEPHATKTKLSLSKRLVSLVHRLYKVCISPLFGNACRFYPSCSDYAREAIEHHGWLRGGVLACKRICRCHPWHPGGDDPVPPNMHQERSSTPPLEPT